VHQANHHKVSRSIEQQPPGLHLQRSRTSCLCCQDHTRSQPSTCSALGWISWRLYCWVTASCIGSSGAELPTECVRRWKYVNAPCYSASQSQRSFHSYIFHLATATRRHTVHQRTECCGCSRRHSERPCRRPWLVSIIGSRLQRSGQIVLQFLDCASGQHRARRVGSKTLPGTARLWLKRRKSTSLVAVSVAVLIAAHWSCVLTVFA
jgi:hypothetical protein